MAESTSSTEQAASGIVEGFENDHEFGIGPLESELKLPRQGRSLCFLVVADLDLPSASLLAEAALRELPTGGTLIDGILACGPFVTPESLLPYLHQPPPTCFPLDHEFGSVVETASPLLSLQSLPPELIFALEGLVTGCLSQLESIACRVLWVPSADHDPSTLWSTVRNQHDQNDTFSTTKQCHKYNYYDSDHDDDDDDDDDDDEKRLTPNSRSLHCRSIPLAPALTCCGLAMGFDSRNNGGDPSTCPESDTHDENQNNKILNDVRTVSNLLDLSTNQWSNQNADSNHPLFCIAPAIIVATTTSTSQKVNQPNLSTSCNIHHKHESMLLQFDPRVVLHVHASSGSEERGEPRLEMNKVLHPGSLREHGEYCLVHLEVVPHIDSAGGNQLKERDPSCSSFCWQVSKVDFRYIGDMQHPGKFA